MSAHVLMATKLGERVRLSSRRLRSGSRASGCSMTVNRDVYLASSPALPSPMPWNGNARSARALSRQWTKKEVAAALQVLKCTAGTPWAAASTDRSRRGGGPPGGARRAVRQSAARRGRMRA